MNHIQDFQYRGHEIIILQDNITDLYAVDIRKDNNDGDIIAGYSGESTKADAVRLGKVFVDGYEEAKNER